MDVRTKDSRRGVDAKDVWIDGVFRGAVFPRHRGGYVAVTASGVRADHLFAGIDDAANWLFIHR